MKNYKVNINGLIVGESSDGPFRAIELWTCGDTLDSCLYNTTVSEIDQDGGECDTYGFEDASNKVQDEILYAIAEELGIIKRG